MGKGFGNLYHISGVITYHLSPFEQRAFAGAITKGIPNLWSRFKGQAFRVLPPLTLAYLVYDYAEKLHSKSLRKDPKEFENDE
ncbi:cytochrome b-c1 complex subunit 8-like [Argonauta hians]